MLRTGHRSLQSGLPCACCCRTWESLDACHGNIPKMSETASARHQKISVPPCLPGLCCTCFLFFGSDCMWLLISNPLKGSVSDKAGLRRVKIDQRPSCKAGLEAVALDTLLRTAPQAILHNATEQVVITGRYYNIFLCVVACHIMLTDETQSAVCLQEQF